nr:GPW/gp25 family protein [Alteraurantiacibacter aestuarii]
MPAGPTRLAEVDDVLAQMLAQIVLVRPGERVNRPDFGSPLHDLVFDPSSEAVTAAFAALVQSAIRQWGGTTIDVLAVDIKPAGERAEVHVTYCDARTRTAHRIVLPYYGETA